MGPVLCCEVGRTDLTMAVTDVCRDIPVWKVKWLLWGDPESNTGFWRVHGVGMDTHRHVHGLVWTHIGVCMGRCGHT